MKFLIFILFLVPFLLACPQNGDECIAQVKNIRPVWKFVPEMIQRQMIGEAVNILLGLRVFRNSTRPTLTQAFIELGDEKVEPAKACANAEKVIFIPMREVTECTEKCYERSGLSWIWLVSTAFKCRTDTDCYITEIQKVLRILVPCIQQCV